VTALKQTPPILDPHYRLPRVLNHYTSIASLLAILNSGHIWATHCQYLNDESEIKNFRNFLGQLLRLANEQSADFKRRHAPLLSSLLNEVQNDTNVYIASFSSIGDDLTQWRAYCPSGAGVSIGFDSRALEVEYISGTSKDDFIEVNAFLEKVRYMSAGWAKGFFRNLDRMGENSDQAADPLRGLIGVSKREAHARLLSAWLATAAPLYKDASFASEREWRIVLIDRPPAQPHMLFRPGKSTLIPYVEAVLNRGIAGKSLAPYIMRRVIVGPTPNMSIALAAIRSLFDSIGHPEVKVEPSQIPFRHW
jgi:hypothetical protein